MMSYRILRFTSCKKSNVFSFKYLLQPFCSDSSDNEKRPKKSSPKQVPSSMKSEDALKKLNLLLQQMVHDDNYIPTKSDLNLARPKTRAMNMKDSTTEKKPKDIMTAAKDVAKSIGGDVQQTESELLTKLLKPVSKDTISDSQGKPLMNLSDVIAGMKIDRTVKANTNNEVSRAHQVRQLLDRTGDNRRGNERSPHMSAVKRRTSKIPDKSNIEKVDFFGGSPLGIFTSKSYEAKEEKTTLKTWEELTKRELRLAVTHPPENYFQEMILWTQQGKVWQFPIDNEQGLEDEKNVYFAEHIFLEKHLESWCPVKGPIRHFMELVCVGLSKNPYLGADAKREHIEWFKNYFSSKDQLLKELGAIPINNNVNVDTKIVC